MDLSLTWSDDGGDLALEAGDLRVDRGLSTAVLLSLFSDGRARVDGRRPRLEQDLRGWWAEDPRQPFGSRLWTLARAKALPTTAAAAEEAAEEALAWAVSSGLARSVSASAELDGPRLRLSVVLERGTARRYADLWQAVTELSLVEGGLLLDLSTR